MLPLVSFFALSASFLTTSAYDVREGDTCSCTSPAASTFANRADVTDAANKATTPVGYVSTGSNGQGWLPGDGSLGFVDIDRYDSTICAGLCDTIKECSTFQIYFEQGHDGKAQVKCAFWGGLVDAGKATAGVSNAIAGCNTYTSNKVVPPSGFETPKWFGNSVFDRSAGSEAAAAFVGSKVYHDEEYDTSRCADDMSALGGSFYNTYMVAEDGKAPAQHCDVYYKPISDSAATNTGDSDGQGKTAISNSFACGIAKPKAATNGSDKTAVTTSTSNNGWFGKPSSSTRSSETSYSTGSYDPSFWTAWSKNSSSATSTVSSDFTSYTKSYESAGSSTSTGAYNTSITTSQPFSHGTYASSSTTSAETTSSSSGHPHGYGSSTTSDASMTTTSTTTTGGVSTSTTTLKGEATTTTTSSHRYVTTTSSSDSMTTTTTTSGVDSTSTTTTSDAQVTTTSTSSMNEGHSSTTTSGDDATTTTSSRPEEVTTTTSTHDGTTTTTTFEYHGPSTTTTSDDAVTTTSTSDGMTTTTSTQVTTGTTTSSPETTSTSTTSVATSMTTSETATSTTTSESTTSATTSEATTSESTTSMTTSESSTTSASTSEATTSTTTTTSESTTSATTSGSSTTSATTSEATTSTSASETTTSATTSAATTSTTTWDSTTSLTTSEATTSTTSEMTTSMTTSEATSSSTSSDATSSTMSSSVTTSTTTSDVTTSTTSSETTASTTSSDVTTSSTSSAMTTTTTSASTTSYVHSTTTTMKHPSTTVYCAVHAPTAYRKRQSDDGISFLAVSGDHIDIVADKTRATKFVFSEGYLAYGEVYLGVGESGFGLFSAAQEDHAHLRAWSMTEGEPVFTYPGFEDSFCYDGSSMVLVSDAESQMCPPINILITPVEAIDESIPATTTTTSGTTTTTFTIATTTTSEASVPEPTLPTSGSHVPASNFTRPANETGFPGSNFTLPTHGTAFHGMNMTRPGSMFNSTRPGMNMTFPSMNATGPATSNTSAEWQTWNVTKNATESDAFAAAAAINSLSLTEFCSTLLGYTTPVVTSTAYTTEYVPVTTTEDVSVTITAGTLTSGTTESWITVPTTITITSMAQDFHKRDVPSAAVVTPTQLATFNNAVLSQACSWKATPVSVTSTASVTSTISVTTTDTAYTTIYVTVPETAVPATTDTLTATSTFTINSCEPTAPSQLIKNPSFECYKAGWDVDRNGATLMWGPAGVAAPELSESATQYVKSQNGSSASGASNEPSSGNVAGHQTGSTETVASRRRARRQASSNQPQASSGGSHSLDASSVTPCEPAYDGTTYARLAPLSINADQAGLGQNLGHLDAGRYWMSYKYRVPSYALNNDACTLAVIVNNNYVHGPSIDGLVDPTDGWQRAGGFFSLEQSGEAYMLFDFYCPPIDPSNYDDEGNYIGESHDAGHPFGKRQASETSESHSTPELLTSGKPDYAAMCTPDWTSKDAWTPLVDIDYVRMGIDEGGWAQYRSAGEQPDENDSGAAEESADVAGAVAKVEAANAQSRR